MVSETTGKTVQPKIKKQDDLPIFNRDSASVILAAKNAGHTSNERSKRRDDLTKAEQGERSSGDTLCILSEQKRDIDRILISVEGLQNQMRHMMNAIESLKAGKDLQNSDQASPSEHGPTKEIELLTKNVSGMSRKVNEIDGLSLELKVMKRRVQRLEDENVSTQSTHTVTGLTQDTPRATFARMTGSLARRAIPSGRVTLHLNNRSDPIESLVSNDGAELTSNLLAVEHEDKSVQQGVSPMPKVADQDRGSYIQTRRHPSGNNGLDTRRNAVDADPVHATAVAPLKHRVSIPETDIASSTESFSTSQPSPIQARPPPRSTTPENRAAKRKPRSATSLNNHQVVPVSDSEDDDYDPDSYHITTSPDGGSGGNGRTHRHHRHSAPLKLPTPEWEKPDWTGPTTTDSNAARGRGILRRGVSGRSLGAGPQPKRRKTTKGEGFQGDLILNNQQLASLALDGKHDDGPLSTRGDGEEAALNGRGRPDVQRIRGARDAQGRRLRADGKIDRRSLRYKKPTDTVDIDPPAASEDENNHVMSEVDQRADAENENSDAVSTTEEQPRRKVEKREQGARDAEGVLLKPNGTRDGRSARMNGGTNPVSKAGVLPVENQHERLMKKILGPRR